MKVVKTSINLFENGSKLAILYGSKRPGKGSAMLVLYLNTTSA